MRTTTTTLAVLLALFLVACSDSGTPDDGVSGTPNPAATGAEPYGKIAFVAFRDGNQEIYVMNADGSDERNLTNHAAEDFDPDISRDGSRIAFVSKRSGQPGIYVMNSDGSDLEEVRNTVGGLSPRWSRDGTRLAFSSGGSIYVIGAAGENRLLLMEAEDEGTAAPCRAGGFPGSWSPDDERVAYYSASVSRSIGQVCTVGVDGDGVEVIAQAPDAYLVEPVFSPDGRLIVYRAIIDSQHDIWIVDTASGERTNITDDPALDIEPSWSPDGAWIAFGSLRPDEPHFDIFMMRPDGSDVRRLTEHATKEANPVWGP